MKILPSQFCSEEHPPTSAQDFIGPAREVAIGLENRVTEAIRRGCLPIKEFYAGTSGVGKTTLELFLRHLTGASSWAVKRYSGPDVTIDEVREIASGLHYTHNDLFGKYRIIAIHEVDRMPEVAQVRWLDLMDRLPKHTAVVCTSNMALGDMEKRFQGRFKFSEIKMPSREQIKELIMRWPIPEAVASNIVNNALGDVRIAMNEAEEWLTSQPVKKAA